jgi:hypothetical protein
VWKIELVVVIHVAIGIEIVQVDDRADGLARAGAGERSEEGIEVALVDDAINAVAGAGEEIEQQGLVGLVDNAAAVDVVLLAFGRSRAADLPV